MESLIYKKIAEKINESGITLYQIQKDTGVQYNTLNQIMDGTLKGANMRTVLKLVNYLNLDLTLRFDGKKKEVIHRK